MQKILLLLLSVGTLVGCHQTANNHQKPEIQHSTAGTENSDTTYLISGKNIAVQTQAVLAKNLVNAIQKGGTEYAIAFCNTQATVLTDSMAQVLHAKVKRVTDKPRNVANLANDDELRIIEALKKKMVQGNFPEPQTALVEGKIVGYYPIVTNAMCLQCHGNTQTNIMPATLQKIQGIYPNDKATGYKENELRGLWVVEMDKEK
jgi:nitrate reductase cytochrome c-type subunit